MEKVAAVIITYNRLELLKEVVSAVKTQTLKPEKIFVINNSSTDGTAEWLASQTGIIIITSPNLGSSGGQHSGIKAAYESGYDWIWTMDDDVVPDSDCLEKLLSAITEADIRAPFRVTKENRPYFNDTIRLNLTNPFSSIWNSIISENNLKNDIIYAEGITFEGPLFRRSVVEKIGLPEKPFFIYGDDTEYFIRAKKAGFSIVIIRDAVLKRQLGYDDPRKALGWKLYYYVRNIIAIDVLHGTPSVRIIRPFGYLLKWLFRCKSFKNVKTVLKAFWDGYFYKSVSFSRSRSC